MKKIIISILLSAALLITFASSAFALDVNNTDTDTACIVSSDMGSIMYKGKTFIMTDAKIAYVEDESEYIDAEFESETTKNRYSSFEVYAYEKCDYILTVQVEVGSYDWETIDYVEESRAAEIEALANGQQVAEYASYDFYISVGDIEDWKNNGTPTQMKGSLLKLYEEYELYATASDRIPHCEVGAIFCIPASDENSVGSYYLLDYSDYDRTYFYSDGTFALDSGVTATVYELNDSEFAAILDLEYAAYGSEEDELDWLVGTEVSDTSIAVACIFFFGLLPLTLAIICLVFIIRRVRHPYRTVLSVVASSCALVIACFIIVFLMLL